MAIINNLSASLVSFKVNDVSKSFLNSGGTYNTPDLLNGGETYDESTLNILSYVFKIEGLQDHIIKDITIQSLLLTNEGELSDGIRFVLNLDGKLINDIINGNSTTKIFGNTKFTLNKLVEDLQYLFTYEISNKESKSCIYCLKSITIELSDIKYKIYISFNGPLYGRSVSKILTSCILLNLGAIDVTFSKDPIKEFDKDSDSVEGRLYLRKDGIFVDGFQYGVNAPATETKHGIVKLSKPFFDYLYEEDEEGNLILIGISAPNEAGVVATSELVYNVIQKILHGEITPPIINTFEIDEDGGIIPPTENGVVASPLLVYNTLASAINYTNEVIAPIQELLDGIEAPLVINIENNEGEKESLGEELTFSNDFELKDKKLYIKWLEII